MTGRLKETVVGSRWFGALHQVFRRRGYEREVAAVVLRSVIASTAAWILGSLVGAPSQVGFAPFSALLVVTPSVYGSVLESGRYVAAVFTGALIAGAGGVPLGEHVWLFVLVVFVALLAGQLPFFRGQGGQIPVIAAFAFAGGTAASLADLGTLLLMVLIGTTTAVVTNTLFAPAIRFRDAENAVLDFAEALGDLVGEMADGFREGEEGLGDLGYWSRSAHGFDHTARNAQSSVSRQEYRARLNPRRLVSGTPPRSRPRAYRDWILALDRSSRHLQSLIRTLWSTSSSRSRFPAPSDAFLRAFAPILDRVTKALHAVREAGEPDRETASPELLDHLDEAERLIARAREDMSRDWDGERWPVHSSLLTDIERLCEELREGHENTEGAAFRAERG